jgi:hypothetical protein
MADVKNLHVGQSPHDSEKGTDPLKHTTSPRHGQNETFREADFMTRNGLNLKSFQRRKSHTETASCGSGSNVSQVRRLKVSPSSTGQ